MPTCPSCNNITFTADAANTYCESTFHFDIDCSANPFAAAVYRLEYSSDDGVTDPWTPVNQAFLTGQFYNLWTNFNVGPWVL